MPFASRSRMWAPRLSPLDDNGVWASNAGIVGLPNVGKSTLFNALTQTAAAQAANYPFSTIDPNVGDVAVPDPRLAALAEIAGSKEIIPTRLTFVDIAGLVRGASKGEGLGNQFLANIRECDAIAHVVRCFKDIDVTHVEDRIDPLSDIATIETELMLADLESLERRIAPMEKGPRAATRTPRTHGARREEPRRLREGRPARAAGVGRGERRLFQSLGLLSSKPVLYVCNVDEASVDKGNAYSDQVKEQAAKEGAAAVIVSAKIESEIAALPETEQKAYLEAIGLTEPGLSRVIRAGYELLHLITFFTAGPKEARAWTVEQGTRPRRRLASSIPISRRASSALRPSPTTIMSRAAAKRARARRVNSGSKERTMGSPTATSCISASPIDRHCRTRSSFEDFPPGEVVEYGGLDVSADDIVAFAREFDPQPFHIDEEAARATTGGLIASGWHTSALLLRMNCDAFLMRAAILAEAGVEEVRWKRPVRPGDRLHVRRLTLAARPRDGATDEAEVEFSTRSSTRTASSR